ncbi:hypothetical protein EKK58_00885 [Candidatus Dependentiae bacterium]|nr:MAG: hypothetical protein EKK58_00885 [Candidatus Dependentiae bacterium]
MTKDQAIRIVSRQTPCAHENADTRLGNGQIWAKCDDCGATFEQAHWDDARQAAKQFQIAIDVLSGVEPTSGSKTTVKIEDLRGMSVSELSQLIQQ